MADRHTVREEEVAYNGDEESEYLAQNENVVRFEEQGCDLNRCIETIEIIMCILCLGLWLSEFVS